MRLRNALASTAALAILVSCTKSPTHESLGTEMVETMKEMGTVLATVDDKASAEAAKPKLESIVETMNGLARQAKELGDPPPEVKAKLEGDMNEAAKGLMGAMMKFAFNTEVSSVLQPVFEKLDRSAMPSKTSSSRGPLGSTSGGLAGLGGAPDADAVRRKVDELMARHAQISGNAEGAEDSGDPDDVEADDVDSSVGSANFLEIARAVNAARADADGIDSTTRPRGAGVGALLQTLTDENATNANKIAALMEISTLTGAEGEDANSIVTKLAEVVTSDEGSGLRILAAGVIASFGERVAPVAKSLAELVDDDTIGAAMVGPLAGLDDATKKTILPTLIGKLEKSADLTKAASIITVISSLGPAASEAIPALDAVKTKFPALAELAKEAVASLQSGSE